MKHISHNHGLCGDVICCQRLRRLVTATYHVHTRRRHLVVFCIMLCSDGKVKDVEDTETDMEHSSTAASPDRTFSQPQNSQGRDGTQAVSEREEASGGRKMTTRGSSGTEAQLGDSDGQQEQVSSRMKDMTLKTATTEESKVDTFEEKEKHNLGQSEEESVTAGTSSAQNEDDDDDDDDDGGCRKQTSAEQELAERDATAAERHLTLARQHDMSSESSELKTALSGEQGQGEADETVEPSEKNDIETEPANDQLTLSRL